MLKNELISTEKEFTTWEQYLKSNLKINHLCTIAETVNHLPQLKHLYVAMLINEYFVIIFLLLIEGNKKYIYWIQNCLSTNHS